MSKTWAWPARSDLSAAAPTSLQVRLCLQWGGRTYTFAAFLLINGINCMPTSFFSFNLSKNNSFTKLGWEKRKEKISTRKHQKTCTIQLRLVSVTALSGWWEKFIVIEHKNGRNSDKRTWRMLQFQTQEIGKKETRKHPRTIKSNNKNAYMMLRGHSISWTQNIMKYTSNMPKEMCLLVEVWLLYMCEIVLNFWTWYYDLLFCTKH